MPGDQLIKEKDNEEFSWCSQCDDRMAFKAYHWDDICDHFCEVCAEELGLVESGHGLFEKCPLKYLF